MFVPNIQTGNSSAQSSIQTDIQGSGSVSIHIQVSANGETKTLDSNSPGTYKLEVRTSNNNSNISNEIIISPVASHSSSPTPAITKRIEIRKLSFLLSIENNFQNLFHNILGVLKK